MSRFRNLLLVGLVAAGAGVALAAEPGGKAGLGRAAHPAEIAAWDIDVRPDGAGLPAGSGSAREGEAIFIEKCAACHGEFGEGVGRWPVLSGGKDTLKSDNPDKTIGSFWPYASIAFDYIRRAMPFGNSQSLTPDETYALVAYLLSMNDVVKDDFVLSKETFAAVTLPNADGFYDDDRETSEKAFWRDTPCMKDCKPEPAKITGRARVIDVTPDSKTAPRVE